jgi:hypothetical protein
MFYTEQNVRFYYTNQVPIGQQPNRKIHPVMDKIEKLFRKWGADES